MNFDDIRPYTDAEVPEKIQRLLAEPQFEMVMTQANPEIPFKLFKAQMSRVKSVNEFQAKIIVPLLEQMLKKTTSGLSVEGLENISADKRYTFISTHRDIALDSAMMNVILLKNGHDTAEIAIGDNLLQIPWVIDLVKLNKTFIVKRRVSKEERQKTSFHLSSYIHHAIKEKNQSVWIAQKAGRSKDGNDRTNPSIIKMFSLGGGENIKESLSSLNICPVSISYEYNACDHMMLPEVMAMTKGEAYEKQPMEDMMQMAEGVTGQKGALKVSFGQPISVEEILNDVEHPNEMYAKVAKAIDSEIHSSYALMPTNYMAYDLLEGNSTYGDKYNDEQLSDFENYLNQKIEKVDGSHEEKKSVLLKMYAYPVYNRLESKA